MHQYVRKLILLCHSYSTYILFVIFNNDSCKLLSVLYAVFLLRLHGVCMVVVLYRYYLPCLYVGAGNQATAYCTLNGQIWLQYLSLKPYQINIEYYQFLT